MMRLHHFTMLMIHESLIKPPSSHNAHPKQFQIYQRVTESIRAWLDLYFSIPLDQLQYLPCGNYSQLYYIMMFMYRISTFNIPAWTTLVAEASVEVVPILNRLIQKFEQAEAAASQEAPDSGADEAFLFGIQKFSAIRTICETELTPEADRVDNSALSQDPLMDGPELDLTTLPVDSAFFSMMTRIFDDVTWQ